MTESFDWLPEHTRKFIASTLKGRRLPRAKLVKSAPEGTTLIRASFVERRFVGGPAGSYSRDREIVRWYGWNGTTFVGGFERKAYALEILDWVSREFKPILVPKK